MPKTKISEYSTTNADNTDIEGINIAENCPPSGINNAIREVMVHLKEFQTGASGDGFTFAGGVLISGTANTITGNVVMSGTNTLSGATSAAFAAGTVSAPSIYASGDTNTGVFFPAADTIAITEGGVEVVRVNSSSNVGIGTDSPGSKLDVKGTLRLSGSSSGYVGIAPAAAAGSTTYTLPSADGSSGQVLSTNGSGTLSWATASGGGSSITAGDSKVEVTDTGSNGTITFTTDNSERMRIDSSGNVGIGTSTIGTRLVLATSDAATTGQLRFARSADVTYFWEIGRDNSVSGDFLFSNATGGAKTERARITSGGNVDLQKNLGLGGASATTSGTGITFPATQSASTDANTLDDYEQGTFSPTVIGSTSAGTGTYTTQVGRYTKIGNVVTVWVYLNWSAHTGTGDMSIGNFPFASVNVTGYRAGAAFGLVDNIALTANNLLTGNMSANATQFACVQYPVGGGTAALVPIDTAGQITFTLTYESAN